MERKPENIESSNTLAGMGTRKGSSALAGMGTRKGSSASAGREMADADSKTEGLSVSERKVRMRAEYREKRNLLTEAQVREYSDRICRKLLAFPLFLQAETIYFYYPLGREVSLLPAAEAALAMGKRVGFPKTEGTHIRFYRTASLNAFAEGRFHVKEPVSSELLTDPAPLILTPGLVFDEKRNRMGYGKGYYDRYGAEFPEAVRIGIAYELQIAKEAAVDAYDVPMEFVVTEERILGW